MSAPLSPLWKLSPPVPAPWLLARQALVDQVLGAAESLVVLHAGAGFGKSTLMAQCHAACAAQGVAACWLTLDRSDADLSRLLQSLTWALEPVLQPRAALGGALLDRVAASDGRWLLCIDEVEHLQDQAAHGTGASLLVELARHLPRGARLVLAARRLPPPLGPGMPLDLQARVIDDAALRMDLDDARGLARNSAVADLDDLALARLHGSAEGWPLGLAMALAGRRPGAGAQAAPQGSAGPIHDYLAEEVFGQQPAALRDFMLRTSVLQTLSPALCQVLCPQVEAGVALRQLDVDRSFVLRVGGAEDTWRYHRLLADFLRGKLQRDDPEQFNRMHLLAAGWHEAQGRSAPAIEHAIAGGDLPWAVLLLERSADDFLAQDRFRLLLRWFDALGPAALVGRPLLQATQAWCVCLTQGADRAAECLAQHGLDRSGSDPQVQALLVALQAMRLAKDDRYAEALETARQAMAPWSQAEALVSPFAAGVLSSLLAHVGFVLGQALPPGVQALPGAAGGRFEHHYHQTTLALMELQDGQLRRAEARLRAAIGRQEQAAMGAPRNPWLAVPYAATLYETGAFAQADPLLAVHMAAARDAAMPDHMIVAATLRSRIAHAAGDVARALEFLVNLEHDGLRRRLPRVAAGAHLERARLLLLCGRHEAAAQSLARAESLFDWAQVAALALPAHDTETPAIGRARLHLALGQVEPATAVLRQAWDAAGPRRPRRMKLAVLSAAAAWLVGDADGAVQRLGPVLQTCAEQGYLRIVVDEGLLVAPLLQRLRLNASRGVGASADPLVCDLVDRMLAALGVPAVLPDGARDPDSALTRKEFEVLQALAEGCSNQTIGERFGISDSTVRTHLRKINAKLGAQSRSQAVALGRRLKLLS